MNKIIAILEDNDLRTQAMRAAVADVLPDATCVFFNSANAIIEWLKQNITTVSLISLDHDLDFLTGHDGRLIDPGDGRDVARFLAGLKPCCPVIVHTSNSMAASSMMFTLQDAGWQVERVLPDNDLLWVSERWKPIIFRFLASESSCKASSLSKHWITSLGGPLLLLPESVLKYWTGYKPSKHPAIEGVSFRWQGDPDGPVTDYDRACSVEGYVGLIDIGEAKGLILGDEPNLTTWIPTDDGGLLVRWVYADNEENVLRSLRGLSDADFGKAELLLPVPAGTLLLFDSVSPGDEEARDEALAIQLLPASYEVSTADYKPDKRTELIIHRLRVDTTFE